MTQHRGRRVDVRNGRLQTNPVNFPTTGLTLSFQLYLDGAGNALAIGTDSYEVTEGPAFAQTATQSALGYYPIDNARTIAIEVDGSQLGLLFVESATLTD